MLLLKLYKYNVYNNVIFYETNEKLLPSCEYSMLKSLFHESLS